ASTLSLLEVAPVRWIYPMLLRRWHGGAVKVAGTVAEGDEVAGFRVLHFPGHAPGLIGLWRESDRLARVRCRLPGRLGAAETAARGRGERPPPRLQLEPPGGEALLAAAGGARTAGRRDRSRAAPARRAAA